MDKLKKEFNLREKKDLLKYLGGHNNTIKQAKKLIKQIWNNDNRLKNEYDAYGFLLEDPSRRMTNEDLWNIQSNLKKELSSAFVTAGLYWMYYILLDKITLKDAVNAEELLGIENGKYQAEREEIINEAWKRRISKLNQQESNSFQKKLLKNKEVDTVLRFDIV